MKKDTIKLKDMTDLVLTVNSMSELPRKDIECDEKGWDYVYKAIEEKQEDMRKSIISLMRLNQLIFAITKDRNIYNGMLSDLQTGLYTTAEEIEKDKLKEQK